MLIVQKLNKIVISFLFATIIWGCNSSNRDNNNKLEVKEKEQAHPLKIDLDFNDFGTIEFGYDSLNWDKISGDSALFINLKSNIYFSTVLHFKINLVAVKIPFLFQLKKIDNNKIAFLAFQQHNTIHLDSINFENESNKNAILINAYHITMAKNGIDGVTPIGIININDTIDLTKLD